MPKNLPKLPPIPAARTEPEEQQPGETCCKCKGQGKLDSVQKLPWTRHDPEHIIRVSKGQCTPVICDGGCAGTGKIQPKS